MTILDIYSEFIEYLAARATPEEILAFTVSAEAQARAEHLLQLQREGKLTPTDQAELDQMLHFDRLVSALKAKALKKTGSL